MNAYNRYIQDSGELDQINADGFIIHRGVGFAGNDSRPGVNDGHIHGFNNPAAQSIHNIGPLPCGWYTASEPFHHATLGEFTFKLIPDAENEMFGRSAFYMHGESSKDPLNSSEGCIVMPYETRVNVARSNVRRFKVVPNGGAQ